MNAIITRHAHSAPTQKNRKQTGQTGNLSSGFRLIPGYRIRLPGEFTAPARRFVQIEPC